MSTKHIALSILGVAAIIAVLFVSKPWAQENRSNNGVSNVPSVTPTPFPTVPLEELQGIDIPELTYLENGTLYRSKPNDPNERATRRKIVESIDRIFSEKGPQILFGKYNENSIEGTEATNMDLFILDTKTGVSRLIYRDIMLASLSPKGDLIAVATNEPTFELHLIDREGRLLKKIGTHGSSPVFSPDGRYLVYNKLADNSRGGETLNWNDLLMYAHGLALYDLVTGDERMLTHRAGDFGPATFSLDMKRLYFNADDDPFEMKGENGIWMVGIDGAGRKQLTNTPTTPSLPYLNRGENSQVLWYRNGLTLISEFDGVIWQYHLNSLGEITGGNPITEDAKSARWVVQDRILAARGSSGWKLLNVEKSQR